MKRLLIVLIFILTSVISTWYAPTPSAEEIVLDSLPMIHVGDKWQLSLTVDNYRVGDTIAVSLLNGLKTFNKTLILGPGGVAVWQIDEGQIIQAGESLIIVQYGTKIIEKSLTVLTNKPTSGILFTSANSVPAYGEGTATIMFLAEDEWGNIPDISQPLYLEVHYPDGNPPTKELLTYQDGLGRFKLWSKGQAGRIRLSVDQGFVQTNLELIQTAGATHSIDLDIVPKCVLNDGRDLVTLSAVVYDQNRYAVADGTIVTFLWSGGYGYGQTIDGVATLRLPAPETLGQIVYQASVGSILSNNTSVLIEEYNCS